MSAGAEKAGLRRTLLNAGGVMLIVAALAAVPLLLCARTFAFQPFNIPAGSMAPTLVVGDHFFVSKFRYGFSHYSLPFSPPLFSGRIFAAQPERGDVVVFRLPKDDSIDYVKRLVGLPGDRIQMIDGVLHINGQAVKREPAGDYLYSGWGDEPVQAKRWHETLPNGVRYDTIQVQATSYYDNTPEYLVPPGHYFMIGDNRQNSQDSRVLSAVGYVPFENLIGRAEIIFYSLAGSERMGMRVR